jgi:hypothetical protein
MTFVQHVLFLEHLKYVLKTHVFHLKHIFISCKPVYESTRLMSILPSVDQCV